MMELTGIRLVNWYHFIDETRHFSGSTMLIGNNAAGKSTVLDALQFALIGNLAEVKFNPAAHERGDRNLYKYLRWYEGTEGAEEFLRGACSGFILIQFEDREREDRRVVFGVAMQAFEHDTDVNRQYVVLPGLTLDQVPCLGPDGIVLDPPAFRAVAQRLPGARVMESPTQYQAELRQRLGRLPQSFHRYILKGLEFKPMRSVKQFVKDFLADEKPIATGALISNLKHYTAMLREAESAKARIAELAGIVRQGDDIVRGRATARRQHFIAQRAGLDMRQDGVTTAEATLRQTGEDLTAAEGQLKRAQDQVARLGDERDRILGQLAKSTAYQRKKNLERDLEEATRRVDAAEESVRICRDILEDQRRALGMLLSDDARRVRREHPALFEGLAEAVFGVAVKAEERAALEGLVAEDAVLAGRPLTSWQRKLDSAMLLLNDLRSRIGERRREQNATRESVRSELDRLGRGEVRYEREVEAFRHLLHLNRGKLRGRAPRLLCELLEVADPKWSPAIEAMLGRNRFYVVVDADDFGTVRDLYARYRDQCPQPGYGTPTIPLWGVGVINTRQLLADAPTATRGSLAEQVTTDDPIARAYINQVLGTTMCCEEVKELERHRRAVHPTRMTHIGNVLSRMKDVRPYIGAAARERRREELVTDLAGIDRLLTQLGEAEAPIQRARETADTARHSLVRLADHQERAAALPGAQRDRARAQTALDTLDVRETEALETQLAQTQRELKQVDDERSTVGERVGTLRERVATQTAALAASRREYTEWHEALNTQHPNWASDPGYQEYRERYRVERETRASADIERTFREQHKGTQTAIQRQISELGKAKIRYEGIYGVVPSLDDADVEAYRIEQQHWEQSKLAEYTTEMARSREQALEQIADHVLCQLAGHCRGLKRMFSDLNRALRERDFGTDRYQFDYTLAANRREYYELADRVSNHSVNATESVYASVRQDPQLSATLERLLTQLTADAAKGDSLVAEELRSITDYRDYFDYDIRIHHATGKSSSYTKVWGGKSGGETQTPYYITMLASMYQLYRVGGDRLACGLVLVDEAFTKMDDKRIPSVLRLARELGLQLLLATPMGRAEAIAPWVDTTILVHKDDRFGRGFLFDFTKEYEAKAALAAGGGDATATDDAAAA